MEDLGTCVDIPVDTILAAWERTYGKERVSKWINDFEKLGGKSGRDFDKEEIIK